MRHFIGHREIVTGDDTLRFALDLWLGPGDETPEERAARLDAGRQILADDPDLFDRAMHLVTEVLDHVATDVLDRAHLTATREVTAA
ncbi:hypothetical protein [Streptomyces sp. TS71-3]|uniref:hypothetical protein n=1 Tax=Streptomyces sp. TS71-3 TaxID=2733862 RepID=UPI001B0C6086|nr:hypothetical protein [Streptomyces sp. TS71-3]GHJ36032.1 hypothetical protein Sm713_16410 [Streptomyces sp. TS71-3]